VTEERSVSAACGARTEEHHGVLTVTLDRQDKLNAVDDAMIAVLRSAVSALGERSELRVLVIQATGRYFTSGIDTGRFAQPPSSSGLALRREYRELHVLLDDIEAVEKPVVVAVQGPCVGFGLEMALSCDFRVASTRASFWLPEIEHLAVLPGSGGISRLTRAVGPHWARWVAMAGHHVGADQALAIGLVHQVVDEADLRRATESLTDRLVGLSAEAVGLAKMTIDAADQVDRATARQMDRLANTALLQSVEHQEAVRRLGERRGST
jgi:enoyl-CoA hydratase